MTAKVLRYDSSIVPQERYYDCGPASTQIVLNALGINVSESELIARIGTTERGTDYVGLIERYLDDRTPNAKYTSVYLENDPPTATQKDALWRNVLRSIDSGYGVVMNWVSPPGNRPKAIKGSQQPNYGFNTVYHYVACMGYDDKDRSLWIADSGFRPFEYWVSLDNAASLIPPKGYCFADQVIAKPKVRGLTADTLSAAMGASVSIERYEQLLPAVKDALLQSDCTNINRVAMWMAQIGHESGGLRWMEEIADGSAYEGRKDLGNTNPGDGPRYKGRGPIQITGRSNYKRLSEWAFSKRLVPSATYFVDNPQLLASDRYGFYGAIWYWTVARPNINAMCDAGDVDGVTRAINGGLNGIQDRRSRWNRALELGFDSIDPGAPEGDSYDMAQIPKDQWDKLYSEFTRKLPSRSPLRHLGEGEIDSIVGIDLNSDANLHVLLVKSLAEIGDQGAISLIAEIAGADLKKYPDRRRDSELAQRILAYIEKVNPSALQQFLKKGQ